MSLPLRDHYVKFRSKESIAAIAMQWRQQAAIGNLGNFNIVYFIENFLSKRLKKGPLRTEYFDAGTSEELAYVTFNPLTLHVDTVLWEDAKLGEPYAKFILAHEIGHIVLHDHHAKAFLRDPSKTITFAQNEYSAEWQANVFAAYFLVPDHLVRAYSDFESLATSCAVPAQLAKDRFSDVTQLDRERVAYSGDACPNCSNFTVIRKGLLHKCNTCFAEFMN